MVADAPTALPVALLTMSTPNSCPLVPDDCVDHVAPSVVATTVPDGPTAQQSVVSGQETSFSGCPVPSLSSDQLAPPLVVARISPLWASAFPTAKHVVALGQSIA